MPEPAYRSSVFAHRGAIRAEVVRRSDRKAVATKTFQLDPANGVRATKREEERARAEARQWADEEVARLVNGHSGVVLYENVNALLDAFEVYYARHGMRGRTPDPSTLEGVVGRLRKARKAFGDRAPESLLKMEIQDWRVEIPAGTRHEAFRNLRMALSWAVRTKALSANPTDDIPNPKRAKHERKPVKAFENMAEVERVAAELSIIYAALIVVLACTGMRPEEAFGIEWRDVDFDHRILHLSRRFTRGRLKEGLKSQPDRDVRFGPRVERALKSIPRRLDTRIVFCTPMGSHTDDSAFRNREWLPALRASGLPHHRLYDLRVSFITWALQNGNSPAEVAEHCGTSIAQIDATYSRPTNHALERLALSVDSEAAAQ